MNKAKAIGIMQNILNPYYEVSEVEVRKAMQMGIDAINNSKPLSCEEELKVIIERVKAEQNAETLKKVETEMYHQCFEVDHHEDGLQKWDTGNWLRYKLFENVMNELKGEANE